MTIRLAIIIALLFFNDSLAVNKAQLIEDIQYLLSAEPTIDYDDPKLKKILNKYNYRLFRTYKAFIEFDKSKKTKVDFLKAKRALGSLSYRPKNSYWQTSINQENIILRFFDLLGHYRIANDILSAIPEEKENWKKHYEYKYFKIPLWFILKYPDNLRGIYQPYGLNVNAKKSIRDIEEFNKLFSLIASIHGNFLSTYFGEIPFDSYIMTKRFVDIISFNPDLYIKRYLPDGTCAQQSIQERFSIFREWSYRGEKNILIYNEFLLYFDNASEAIENYYKNNYNLGKYAPYAKDILSHYICEHVSALLE